MGVWAELHFSSSTHSSAGNPLGYRHHPHPVVPAPSTPCGTRIILPVWFRHHPHPVVPASSSLCGTDIIIILWYPHHPPCAVPAPSSPCGTRTVLPLWYPHRQHHRAQLPRQHRQQRSRKSCAAAFPPSYLAVSSRMHFSLCDAAVHIILDPKRMMINYFVY